jgi:hypothetical protein
MDLYHAHQTNPSSSQNPPLFTQIPIHHETSSPPQNPTTTPKPSASPTPIFNLTQNTTPHSTRNPQNPIQTPLYSENTTQMQAGKPSPLQIKPSTCEPKTSLTPIFTPPSSLPQSTLKQNPIFIPNTATTDCLGVITTSPNQAAPHVTLDLGSFTNTSDTSLSTSQPTHAPQQSSKSHTKSVRSLLPHVISTQSEPSPQHAVISQPIPNIDPNSSLTEAFLLFKVTFAFLNKPADPFIRSNNLNGPSTCKFELIENDPTCHDPNL